MIKIGQNDLQNRLREKKIGPGDPPPTLLFGYILKNGRFSFRPSYDLSLHALPHALPVGRTVSNSGLITPRSGAIRGASQLQDVIPTRREFSEIMSYNSRLSSVSLLV